jgi:two-component system, LuxR family, sensor kinase FixL
MTSNSKLDSLGFEQLIVQCLEGGRARLLTAVIFLIVIIAGADWLVGNSVSLGVFYIFPMMLGAILLRPPETLLLAFACSVLRWWFDTPGSKADVTLRFAFALVAYFSSALFVTALVKNRRLVDDSLQKIRAEQGLRREAETQLRLLIESSPAAILTADRKGVVLAANHAANQMFSLGDENTLLGRNIRTYLPVLGDALQLQGGSEAFRTAAQCQGRRENGEIFLAHTWFSSHGTPEATHISAIVVDSSEEMRDREEQNLRHLLHYNRITAAALAHEVRNISAAIAILSANLNEKQHLTADEDYQGLSRLTRGLEKLALLHLGSHAEQTMEEISLQTVLDNLRIIIEAEWIDIGGSIRWPAMESVPKVLADPNGVLQSLLNLAQNSYRAVRGSVMKELAIKIEQTGARVLLSLQDSGPGIISPERLFRPFESEMDGTGLGLYISRAIVRGFGGELRYQPTDVGCCFVIELQIAN